MTDPHVALIALVLALLSLIALTVWWPNPADRDRPDPTESGE